MFHRPVCVFWERSISQFAIFSRPLQNVRRVIKRYVKTTRTLLRRAAHASNCQMPCVPSCCTSQISTRTAATFHLARHLDSSWAPFRISLSDTTSTIAASEKLPSGSKSLFLQKGRLSNLASMIRKMVFQMILKCVTMDEDICCTSNLLATAGKLPLANTTRKNWMAQVGPDLNFQPVLVWAQHVKRNGHVEAKRSARRRQNGKSEQARGARKSCLFGFACAAASLTCGKRPQDEPGCAVSRAKANAIPA